MELELQSAASRISLVEIPELAAAEVEAALTECALKIEVSIPASWITSFSHHAIVDEVTGRCGFMNEMNNWEEFPRKGWVAPI